MRNYRVLPYLFRLGKPGTGNSFKRGQTALKWRVYFFSPRLHKEHIRVILILHWSIVEIEKLCPDSHDRYYHLQVSTFQVVLLH